MSRHYAQSKAEDNSFGGEWQELKRYLDSLQINSGYVVDVAASDGVTQSCTIPLFRNPNWSGLAVEMDPVKFAKLAYAYAAFENCKLARCRVTPENICSLLKSNEIPIDFEVLNLDIDSYDLFIIKEMLEQGFRPKIITMEVNEKIPPPLYFTVLYDPNHYWKGDHFFGCSVTAASQTVSQFGYILVSLALNNVIFIRADLAQGKIEALTASEAYNSGYRNRAERNKMFPWNADVDCALDMNPGNAQSFFFSFFEKYKGKFDLRIAADSADSADSAD